MGALLRLLASLAALAPAAAAWATTGGPSAARILGWSAARSTVLVSSIPGGENEIVELLAFNLEERVLEKARCESCALVTLASAGGPGDEAPSLEQRSYLRMLRGAARLQKLDRVKPEEMEGISFQCESSRMRRDGEQPCWRHVCRLGAVGQPAERLEFLALHRRFESRLYRIPGVSDAVLAWIIRTGLDESGYREDEFLVAPRLPQRTISMRRFADKYFPSTATR